MDTQTGTSVVASAWGYGWLILAGMDIKLIHFTGGQRACWQSWEGSQPWWGPCCSRICSSTEPGRTSECRGVNTLENRCSVSRTGVLHIPVDSKEIRQKNKYLLHPWSPSHSQLCSWAPLGLLKKWTRNCGWSPFWRRLRRRGARRRVDAFFLYLWPEQISEITDLMTIPVPTSPPDTSSISQGK